MDLNNPLNFFLNDVQYLPPHRYQAAVQCTDTLPFGAAVKQPRNQAIGHQFKSHGCGRWKEYRHPENGGTQHWRNQTNDSAVLPAADQPAEEHGKCIGRSMLPIRGICPVRNGSTSPSARNIAAKTIFLIFRFIVTSPISFYLFHFWKNQPWPQKSSSLFIHESLIRGQTVPHSPSAL